MSTTTVPFSSSAAFASTTLPWPAEIAKLPDLLPEEVGTVLPKLLAALTPYGHGARSRRVDAQGADLAAAQRVGDKLVLLGGATDQLVGSQFVRVHHGVKTDFAVEQDPQAEKRLTRVVTTLINAGVASSAHALAPGGLVVTVAEKLLAARAPLGAKLDLHCFGTARTDSLLFGENQGRMVISVKPERVGTVLSEAHTNGVAATVVGEVTADPVFVVSTRRVLAQWSLDELKS
ncbi:AIR synthase-related protein [Nibricoccus sp. IMCC34717]|uniref:AIR synthase-related protein n=1 Tax=Nibricoccus sp. IMCC34717 TaxID=3034021 RepID=UPI00384DBE8C